MSLAKNKAEKIFKENLEWIGKTYFVDGLFSMDEKEKAKGCSLNCVNEILSWNPILFWENVKDEIINL